MPAICEISHWCLSYSFRSATLWSMSCSFTSTVQRRTMSREIVKQPRYGHLCFKGSLAVVVLLIIKVRPEFVLRCSTIKYPCFSLREYQSKFIWESYGGIRAVLSRPTFSCTYNCWVLILGSRSFEILLISLLTWHFVSPLSFSAESSVEEAVSNLKLNYLVAPFLNLTSSLLRKSDL